MDTRVSVEFFSLKQHSCIILIHFFCDIWCNKLFEFILQIVLVLHDWFVAFNQIQPWNDLWWVETFG